MEPTGAESAVKRGIVVGVAGVAVVVAACAGCSSKSNTGASSTAPAAAPQGPQLVVDGQRQNITGQVTCTVAPGALLTLSASS
jgi:lipoprotein LpqH